jgi:hypothetical protein
VLVVTACIYSIALAALFLFICNKTAEWLPASDRTDDDNLAGLRLGEVCVIPYGGGTMLNQQHIPVANPVFFVEYEADARAAVASVRLAEYVDMGESSTWEIQPINGVWWFARKYYHDSVSLRTLAAQIPIPEVESVREAVEYLAGLRTSGDRRGRPQ